MDVKSFEGYLSETLNIYFSSPKNISFSDNLLRQILENIKILILNTIISPDILVNIDSLDDLDFSFIISFGSKEMKDSSNLNQLKNQLNRNFFKELRDLLKIEVKQRNIKKKILKDFYLRNRIEKLIEESIKELDNFCDVLKFESNMNLNAEKEDAKKWFLMYLSYLDLKKIQNENCLEDVIKIVLKYTKIITEFNLNYEVDCLIPKKCLDREEHLKEGKIDNFLDLITFFTELEEGLTFEINEVRKSKNEKLFMKKNYIRNLKQKNEIEENKLVDLLKSNLKYFNIDF
jgi:hypothetical protein